MTVFNNKLNGLEAIAAGKLFEMLMHNKAGSVNEAESDLILHLAETLVVDRERVKRILNI